jgi:hypothetical protein
MLNLEINTMTDKQDDTPKEVRDWYAKIGRKGGSASKGTEAAKIRSAKATSARLQKEAALKEQGQIPATLAWQKAVKAFLQETKWSGSNAQENKDKFSRNYMRCIENDDMRYLGTGYFEIVKRYLEEK